VRLESIEAPVKTYSTITAKLATTGSDIVQDMNVVLPTVININEERLQETGGDFEFEDI
jgi:hypothetical protein